MNSHYRSALIACAGLAMACGPVFAAENPREPIFGTIDHIQDEQFSISGDHGKQVDLRRTADTKVVCTSGGGSQLSTSREAVKDIPPNLPQGQSAPGLEQGSEFISQSKEGCTFQVGDYVKVIRSDAGTMQVIQKLARDRADSQ